jgi:hypothetical protein
MPKNPNRPVHKLHVSGSDKNRQGAKLQLYRKILHILSLNRLLFSDDSRRSKQRLSHPNNPIKKSNFYFR